MTKQSRHMVNRKEKQNIAHWVAGILVVLLVSVGAVYGFKRTTRAEESLSQPAKPIPTSTADVQRIGPEEAIALINQGQAILYDTRSAASYAASHATGAISLPTDELQTRLASLPQDKVLIFYCT